MSTEAPTWIVLARDVTGTVTVADQPSVMVALVLDADTGLVRGVSVGDTVPNACSGAARTALSAPAGPLPPQPPGRVVYDEAQADGILQAMSEALPGLPGSALVPATPPPEAEDIFDSLIGHLTGTPQPTEPPTPSDWARLYAEAAAYCHAQPWHLWSDTDQLRLTTVVDGEKVNSLAVVYGGQGIQSGLAMLPAQAASPPMASPTLPPGTLVLFLDPPDEVPPERLAKALRHGWPDDAGLGPVLARLGPHGLLDLDRAGARHLALALAAVVAHRGPRHTGTTTGTLLLGGDAPGTYTISDPPPTHTARPPVAPGPPPSNGSPPLPLPLLPGPLPLAPLRTARLRVTLREVVPSVVRVLDVPATATLPEVHDVLQVTLGWTDSHLHEFETADRLRYGHPEVDSGDDGEVRDETTATLRDLPTRFIYRYDFGDGWEHDVEVTGRGGPLPGCVDGTGACPPEDCGGPHGYAELLDALADPSHPDHDHLSGWASAWSPTWSDDDRAEADRLVRATVGQVPASVRLLLDLIGDKVRLTPGGRLPRALVRAVQEQRTGWAWSGRPASVEEDLPTLAALHDLLRRVGLLRLARGVLTPTKAAGDDLQTVRRLRRAFEPDGFDDILTGVATAHLAARGALPRAELAALTHPWLDRWAIGGRPVTPDDIDTRLRQVRHLLEALDLVQVDRSTWHPGPAAQTLLPRATALAHLFRREETPA